MKFMLSLALLLSLNICANAYFLSPEILDPRPFTVPICFDNTIESAAAPTTPYISCGTSQAIKIVSALHMSTTTPTTCPNQFVVPLALLNGLSPNAPNTAILPIDPCVLPINNNVTQNLIQRCNGQSFCVFKFSQILNPLGLNCLDQATNVISSGFIDAAGTTVSVPIQFTNLKVTYFCDGPRKRFRPFSNKRFDPKFSPALFHTVRHPSNNRFVA